MGPPPRRLGGASRHHSRDRKGRCCFRSGRGSRSHRRAVGEGEAPADGRPRPTGQLLGHRRAPCAGETSPEMRERTRGPVRGPGGGRGSTGRPTSQRSPAPCPPAELVVEMEEEVPLPAVWSSGDAVLVRSREKQSIGAGRRDGEARVPVSPPPWLHPHESSHSPFSASLVSSWILIVDSPSSLSHGLQGTPT